MKLTQKRDKQMTFELLNNAKIELTTRFDDNANTLAHITINDQYEHTFDKTSRLSKALNAPSTEAMRVASKQLQDRLTGGSFFLVDNELVDFRDKYHSGFTHSIESINKMFELIGYSKTEHAVRSGLNLTTVHDSPMLVSRHSTEGFNVPGYIQGGKFTSTVLFSWNPYVSFIRGAFELVREICTNGAIATTDLISTRIPIINRWEEHLEIANHNMQLQVQKMATNRLADMSNERAFVRDLQLAYKHVSERKGETFDVQEKQRLTKIGQIIDPVVHLSGYYSPETLNDTNLTAQIPSHLTNFDLYNLITEMSTHTNETNESTTSTLQRMANRLFFANKDSVKTNHNKTPILSAFSDPDVAFFGA